MRRETWKPILEDEVQRWCGKTFGQLQAELQDEVVYEVERAGCKYQVEVQVLERSADRLHVMVAVDDGTLPRSLMPMCETFVAFRR